ncbi:MAG: ATP-binding protein [Kineosporiaceae bacterium]
MRSQVIGSMTVLLVLGLAVAAALSYRVQATSVDSAVAHQLADAVSRFRGSATAVDPATGQPWASGRDLLRHGVDLESVDPTDVLLGVVDGRVVVVQAAPLRRDVLGSGIGTDVAREIGRDAGGYGETRTDSGVLAWAAVPLAVAGDDRPAWFVAAHHRDPVLGRATRDVGGLLTVYLAVVLLVAAVGWAVAGRLLAPLGKLRAAVGRVGGDDLTRRVPAPGTRDEVGDVSRAVNSMLDRLESTFAAQRRFLDDVGHELRTPVTVVRGHLDLVDCADAPDVRATRDLVLDELGRMSRLIDDLLTLARTEQPEFVVVAAVDLEALLDEVLVKMSGIADRSWCLESEVRGEVLLDRDRITQALLELASNAVRHTRDGDVVALGASRVGAGAGDRLLLWVRDTGPGVAPEDASRVFERFGRGAGESPGSGSGLGLAIVSAVAEGHGGAVRLDHRRGDGATFVFDLPWRPAPGPATPPASPPAGVVR